MATKQNTISKVKVQTHTKRKCLQWASQKSASVVNKQKPLTLEEKQILITQQKMDKRPEGAIYKKNINMSFEHMKIYSTSFILR